MKKSELTQLTQIVEHLVRREIKKQLPGLIAEVFQSMAGKAVVNEAQPDVQPIREQIEEPAPEQDEFKASLKELFAGATPVSRARSPEEVAEERPFKQYTKNPVLNQILNETTSDLRSRERMMGAAAFQGGYSPDMPSVVPTDIPTGSPPVLAEGQTSTHAPLEALPEGLSALDVARQVPLAAPVAQALTKNYSAMMKLIDQKQGRK